MRILFATSHPHMPQIAGGLQANTDETVRYLRRKGHHVSLLCGLTGDGMLGWQHRVRLKLSGGCLASDRAMDYRCFRAWRPTDPGVVAAAIAAVKPDVVIGQGGQAAALVQAFGRHGVRGVLYFHNVEYADLGGSPNDLDPDTTFISNSEFTSRKVREAFGIESDVILPLIDRAAYAVETTRKAVVFVNPHPCKGFEIACNVAQRCPDIPFTFMESWTLSSNLRRELAARLDGLPNVTLRSRTKDMRAVYGHAKLILAPSIWEETFGRVVAEGHVSGIPAVASNIGGLPEATGPGGVLLDPQGPVEDWIAAVRLMWDDDAAYAKHVAAAHAYGQRAELNTMQQLAMFEEVLNNRLRRKHPPAASLRHLKANHR